MIAIDTPDTAPVVVLDDVYSADELELIWKELSFLTSPDRLQPADMTSTAKDEGGEYKKTASGVFLDSFYGNRMSSDILRINRKLFEQEIYDHAVNKSVFYRSLRNMRNDFTLINYYDDAQEYKPHYDVSVFTAVTFFVREPVKFSGGDLVFPEFDFTTTLKNNRMVLFPGIFLHGVTPIHMNETMLPYSGFGRYSMAQLLYSK